MTTPTSEQRKRVRTLCRRNSGPHAFDCLDCDAILAYGDERAAEAQGIIERQGEIIEDLRRQLGLPETPEAALFEALSETRTLASGVTLIQRVDLSAHAEREAQERGEEER